MSPRVVLVGLPGTGKSTSGRRLSRVLSLPFADSDHLVETVAGHSVPELIDTVGERAFRDLEAQVVAYAVDAFPGVLALGGGALTTPATRRLLRASGVPVAVLVATTTTLGGRVGDARTRPLLAADPLGRLAALAQEREPHYAEVATFRVDTDGRHPGQVAATIAARLHQLEVTT